jgi:hypothetical protein
MDARPEIGSGLLALQRRRALRRAVRTLAVAERAADSSSGCYLVTNLSESGAWIEAGPLARVGDELLLRLLIPGDTPHTIGVRARVVHVHATEETADGAPTLAAFGLAFTELSQESQVLLRRALRGLPPPLPLARFVGTAGTGESPHARLARHSSPPGLMTTILMPS